MLRERGEVNSAYERTGLIKEEMDVLADKLEDEIDMLNEKYDIDRYEIETTILKPRKTDIDVELCAIVWRVAL